MNELSETAPTDSGWEGSSREGGEIKEGAEGGGGCGELANIVQHNPHYFVQLVKI